MSKSSTIDTYPTYKQSGVQWLGDIPSHWETWKITHAISDIGSGTTPKSDNSDYYNGDMLWVTTSELRENFISDTKQKVSDIAIKEYSALKVFPKNSVAIAMYGATIGRLGILQKEATFNQACCVFGCSQILHHKFLFYWLWYRRPILISLSNGGGQPNLSQDDLKRLKIPLPPPTEQTAIAHYLDRETAKIDALLQKQAELLAKLSEKRTALIAHAVTKGLNPNVPMKNSGVQWLGEVPENWDIKKLKFVIRNISEKVDAQSSELRYFGLENIQSFTGKLLDDIELVSEGIAHYFQENDVLFGKLRPYLAKIHLSKQKGLVSTEALVWRSGQKIHPKFLFYYSLSPNFIDVVNGTTFGSKMPRASWEDIANLRIAFPTIDEQTAITNYLDTETAKIDALCDKIRELSDRLTEYRTTLISDAVTGKIKVIP